MPMREPTEQELERITEIIENSIDQLIDEDSDIFNTEIEMPHFINENERQLLRELHETAINHRVAYYIETAIRGTDDLGFYKVDIEYNRYYGDLKMLVTVDGLLSVRPDIVVHTRMDDTVEQQHLLVIEAKKGNPSVHDIKKVRGFISDDNYNYLFGLTISYCQNENFVMANLYYFNGNEIIPVPINRPK